MSDDTDICGSFEGEAMVSMYRQYGKSKGRDKVDRRDRQVKDVDPFCEKRGSESKRESRTRSKHSGRKEVPVEKVDHVAWSN